MKLEKARLCVDAHAQQAQNTKALEPLACRAAGAVILQSATLRRESSGYMGDHFFIARLALLFKAAGSPAVPVLRLDAAAC